MKTVIITERYRQKYLVWLKNMELGNTISNIHYECRIQNFERIFIYYGCICAYLGEEVYVCLVRLSRTEDNPDSQFYPSL